MNRRTHERGNDMKKWLTILVGALLVAGAAAAWAQDDTGRYGLGLDLGLWKQIGGEHDYSNLNAMGGVRVRRVMTPRLALDLGLKYGTRARTPDCSSTAAPVSSRAPGSRRCRRSTA
jgi:hypothetical protein